VNISDLKKTSYRPQTSEHTHIVLIYIFYNRWPRFDVLKLCL